MADTEAVVATVLNEDVLEVVDDGTGVLTLLATGSDAELDSGPCTPLSSRYDSWPLGDATLLNLSDSGACDGADDRQLPLSVAVVVGLVTEISEVFLADCGTGSAGPEILPGTRDDPGGLDFTFSDCDLTEKVVLVTVLVTEEGCVLACSDNRLTLSVGDFAVVSTCAVLGFAVETVAGSGHVAWSVVALLASCCRAARRA